MAGGTGQDAPDTQRASLAPVVLDDSDYKIPDEWGLKEAYNDPEPVVHHGDTLFIAGTHSLRDAVDDLLLPLNLVRRSQRCQQALAALQWANGRVKYLSGHSLGGAVVAALQEDAVAGNLGPKYRGFREVRTYGAPLLHSDHIPNLHAYRRGWDLFQLWTAAQQPRLRPAGTRTVTGATIEQMRCCRSPGQVTDEATCLSCKVKDTLLRWKSKRAWE